MEEPIQLVRPRRPPSVKKCMGLGCLLVLGIFGAAIGCLISYSTWQLVQSQRYPHKHLYHDVTSADEKSPVVPLLSRTDTFDIAFTVFARVPEADVDRDEAEAEEMKNKERLGPSLTTLKKMTGRPETEILRDLRDVVLYQGIILEGMSIEKGRGMGSVNLTMDIPLKRFDEYIYHNDIRGAIMLLPHSDRFGRVTNHTDWRPAGVTSLRRYTEEFGSQRLLDKTPAQLSLLRDAALTINMIQLHAPPNQTSDAQRVDSADEGDTGDQRERIWKEYLPYFITRSHIYVMDETEEFNRTAFTSRHNKLKRESCGLGIGVPALRLLCLRDYPSHGPFEQLIELGSKGQDEAPELAYAPYLGALRHMVGPKDLQALPVKRAGNTTDAETLRVTHQVTFSALTPGRLIALDQFGTPVQFNSSHTSDQISHAHDEWEQYSGLLGNRAEGSHPWRRFFIGGVIDPLLSLAYSILTPLYWYSRQTTAGIHSISALLFGAHNVLDVLVMVFVGARSNLDWGSFVAMSLISMFDLAIGLIVLRAISPVEMVGWKVQRVKPDKRERQSRRIERQVRWEVWILITLAVLAVSWLEQHYNIHLVSPQHTLPIDEDFRRPNYISHALWTSATVSQIMQLDLNRRSRSYAGGYATAAFVLAGQTAIPLLYLISAVVGKTKGNGLSLTHALNVVLVCAWVYQACRLERVQQVEEEEGDAK